MTSKVDIAEETRLYKEKYSALAEQYETIYKAPAEERFLTSERLRAAHCIDINKDLPVRQTLKHYAVDQRVWHYFLDEVDADAAAEDKKLSRADKQARALKWASENVGKEVTIETLMQECDVAYSMAKKLTQDRPDVFRNVKRGKYQIRDPKADREADKAAAAKEKDAAS